MNTLRWLPEQPDPDPLNTVVAATHQEGDDRQADRTNHATQQQFGSERKWNKDETQNDDQAR